ncbi:MAG: hypothetical protein NTZ16_16345 [Verrucomicrobia bacterium]|nr:hypothetical protein [Verrucomicrobiota bacterium]
MTMLFAKNKMFSLEGVPNFVHNRNGDILYAFHRLMSCLNITDIYMGKNSIFSVTQYIDAYTLPSDYGEYFVNPYGIEITLEEYKYIDLIKDVVYDLNDTHRATIHLIDIIDHFDNVSLVFKVHSDSYSIYIVQRMESNIKKREISLPRGEFSHFGVVRLKTDAGSKLSLLVFYKSGNVSLLNCEIGSSFTINVKIGSKLFYIVPSRIELQNIMQLGVNEFQLIETKTVHEHGSLLLFNRLNKFISYMTGDIK